MPSDTELMIEKNESPSKMKKIVIYIIVIILIVLVIVSAWWSSYLSDYAVGFSDTIEAISSYSAGFLFALVLAMILLVSAVVVLRCKDVVTQDDASEVKKLVYGLIIVSIVASIAITRYVFTETSGSATSYYGFGYLFIALLVCLCCYILYKTKSMIERILSVVAMVIAVFFVIIALL